MNAQTPTPEFDVVVVGAGPTGLTLALLLEQYGARVLLAEMHASTSDEPRAVGLAGESLRIIEQVGVLKPLVPLLRMDVGHRYYGVDGSLLAQVDPQPSPDGFPAKSVFDQPDLEALLAAEAARRPGIDVRFNTTVTLLRQDYAGAQVRLDGPEGSTELTVPWVVGCDGGRSSIRKTLGIELIGETQKERWVCYDVLNEPARENFAELHCNGTRPVVVAPGANNRCRYEVMLHAHEDADEFTTFEMARAQLAQFRDLKPEELRRARVYVAQQRVATSLRDGRVLLCGDAYHLMPPFAGQGLNAGMRDAANLAWKLAAVINGQASQVLLDTYELERKPHVELMVKTSVRIGKVVMVIGERIARTRDRFLRSLRFIPPLWSWLTHMKFMRPPALDVGCVVSTESAAKIQSGNLRGRPLAQFKVSAAGVHFDKLAGEGWLIVAAGEDSAATLANPAVQRVAKLVGARFVQLVSTAAPSAATDVTRIEIAQDLPKWKVGAADAMVLVRPDRYIAAVMTSAEAGTVESELRAWFDA